MLYKLRNQQQPNKGDHWDLEQLFSMERRVAKEWLRFESAGRKRPPFLADDPQGETTTQAAEWLDREHAAMVERLQQEDAKFKEEIKGDRIGGKIRKRNPAFRYAKINFNKVSKNILQNIFKNFEKFE